MIYKPNAVFPNFEVVPVENDTASFSLKIKGVSSPKIFNRARIYLKQGNVERTYYKDIDKVDSGSGSYEINLNLKRDGEIDTEEEIFTIDLNYKVDVYDENGMATGIAHSNEELDVRVDDEKAIIINNGQPIIWKVRLYEDKSLQEEYDEYGDYIGYYNIGSLRSFIGITSRSGTWDRYYRNMRPIIVSSTMNSSDHIKVNKETVVFPRKNTVCQSYIPTTQIAYGTIQALCYEKTRSYTIENTTNSKKFYHLKIYPHDIVNQFSYGNPFYDIDGNLRGSGTWKNNEVGYYCYYYSKRGNKNADSKYARYYIKINNIYYNILDFRYYDWITENYTMYSNNEDGDDGTLDDKYYYQKGNSYFDSYGNPLALYILIAVDVDVDENGNEIENEYTKVLDECDGLDYSIYCNYIDTDQYSFELSSIPTMGFTDINNAELGVWDSKKDAINNPLNISYSNFKISGEYVQPCDTYISEYSSHLYLMKNGVEQLIDKKIGEYSQKYSYEFDELRNSKVEQLYYILAIKIIDNNGNVAEKYICISPNYGQPSNLITAEVNFDYQKKCNVIDFGNLIDISPDEKIKNAHQFCAYDDVGFNKYLHLNKNNSLIYNKKDNIYGGLEIPDDSFINIVVKNDYCNTGQICQVATDGGYIMSLYWNGIQYEYTVQKDGHTIKKCIYYPYKEDIDNISGDMMDNMSKPDLSDETPYIWTDKYVNTTFKCEDYVHAETPVDMYWHSIIFNKDGIKFMRLGNETFTEWIAGEAVTE